MSMPRRVAITGLGVITPIGSGKERFWRELCAGTVGTAEIQTFDTSIFYAHRGGEVRDFNPIPYIRRLDPTKMARTTQLAVAAARIAMEDGELEPGAYAPERVGVCMGTTMGNQSITERDNDCKLAGTEGPDPELFTHYPSFYIPAAIAHELEARGPSLMIPTACAAGNYAISHAAALVRDGLIDVALAGGSDAISRGCYSVFNRLNAIAPEVCRPFDANRQGMLVSEGAAVLVLEELERAVARGATIYAELLGDGLACDAHHPTAPHPEGLGAILAMRRALQSAGLKPSAVSYISAHGTGTKANDQTESKAVYTVFDPDADEIPTSSIKSMLGHTMGAASAIEAVACSLAIYHSMVPPTMNYQEPDPECLKRVVPNRSQAHPVTVAMNNSFAFGGNISTTIFGRCSHG